MTPDLLIVLGLLTGAIVMFAFNRPRTDVVALIMMTALPLTGVISVQEALAGFSDANIVLIAALFVIGEGLVRTGVAQRLGDWPLRRAGHSEERIIPRLMLIIGLVGSVMSSAAVVTLFIPVVLRIVRTTGIAASRLMMPLSMAALISGMMTLIATAPNLVVNSELVRRGFEGFGFFSFTPFGAVILVLAVLFMLLARRLLPAESAAGRGAQRPHLAHWIEHYHLNGREYRLRLTPESPLVGQTLSQLNLRGSEGVNIVAIERAGRFARHTVQPTAGSELQAGDVLLIDLFSPTVNIEEVARRFALESLPLTEAYFHDHRQDIGMVEAMVSPNSRLIGKTVLDVRFRSRIDLTVIGLKRGGKVLEGRALNEPLRAGDTLLLIGPWRAIRRLKADGGHLFVVDLPAEMDDVPPAGSRALYGLGVLALVIVLMIGGIVPNVIAALIGCLLMGLLRCVDLDSAYRSINWQVLILIVGIMPFATALQKTGGTDLIASLMIGTLGDAGIRVILAILFAVTALLGLFISNTATAILMAPVALSVAKAFGASPYPFAMVVALAASTAFMTPVSTPVNTLVAGPGNYSFGDFVRIGVPFSIICLLVTVLLVPWLLPP